MELNEVSQLKEATGVRAANEAIEDGWTLLGFLESTRHGSVTYVLGKLKTAGSQAHARAEAPPKG